MEERGYDQEPSGEPQQAPDADRPAAYAQWENAVVQPWWRRKRPLQVAGAVAVVGIGVGIWFATQPAAAVHVHGSLTLAAGASASVGSDCEGTDGYDDITGGVAVTVGGSSGQTLGIGALSPGVPRYGGFCVFTFDVPVPAGQSLYTVTISHRGTQTVSPAELAGGIQLTLGG